MKYDIYEQKQYQIIEREETSTHMFFFNVSEVELSYFHDNYVKSCQFFSNIFIQIPQN